MGAQRGNFQGWRFVVVKNPAVIAKMGNAVQSVADKVAGWPIEAQWKEEIARHQKKSSFFKEAPVCIAVFANKYESVMDKILIPRESFDPEAKEILAFRRSAPTGLQSAAAAVATLLLVLHNAGLGAVWLANPLIAKKQIERHVEGACGHGSCLPGGRRLSCRVSPEGSETRRGGHGIHSMRGGKHETHPVYVAPDGYGCASQPVPGGHGAKPREISLQTHPSDRSHGRRGGDGQGGQGTR